MTSREVLAKIEGTLQARGFRPAPFLLGDAPTPAQIADRSYRISPGPSRSTLDKRCIETERTFQIAVWLKVPPRGDRWTIGDVLDEEDAVSRFLLELEPLMVSGISSAYALVEGTRYIELQLSLTTRYEREGV